MQREQFVQRAVCVVSRARGLLAPLAVAIVACSGEPLDDDGGDALGGGAGSPNSAGAATAGTGPVLPGAGSGGMNATAGSNGTAGMNGGAGAGGASGSPGTSPPLGSAGRPTAGNAGQGGSMGTSVGGRPGRGGAPNMGGAGRAGSGSSAAGSAGTAAGTGGRSMMGGGGRAGSGGGPAQAGSGSTGDACSLYREGATGDEPDGRIPVCCAPTTAEQPFVDEVFMLLNAHRAANGLSALAYDEELEAAVQGHCVHMSLHDFFAHEAPESGVVLPWDRAELCGTTANGENIARGQRTPAEVMTGWTNSSGHNRNMLGNFRRVGIGYDDNGRYWGQLFGN